MRCSKKPLVLHTVFIGSLNMVIFPFLSLLFFSLILKIFDIDYPFHFTFFYFFTKKWKLLTLKFET